MGLLAVTILQESVAAVFNQILKLLIFATQSASEPISGINIDIKSDNLFN